MSDRPLFQSLEEGNLLFAMKLITQIGTIDKTDWKFIRGEHLS